MTHLSSVGFVILLATVASSDLAAKGKQAQAPQPDMCIVPPGAQPLLPAKLLPGMGITKDFPVTTSSEEARTFFLQGVSQIHSFWFQESERSCTQALELDYTGADCAGWMKDAGFSSTRVEPLVGPDSMVIGIK